MTQYNDEFRVVEARSEGFCILTKSERVVVESEDEYGHYGPIKNIDDARRIVACVNACAGWTTEQLEAMELGSMKEAISRLADANSDPATWEARAIKEASLAADLQAQVDELLAALEGMMNAHQGKGVTATCVGEAYHRAIYAIKKVKYTGEPK
jgi:hypothetical protein